MASMATAAADAGRSGDRFAAVVEEVASKGLTATQLRYYELMRAPDFMYKHLSTAQARADAPNRAIAQRTCAPPPPPPPRQVQVSGGSKRRARARPSGSRGDEEAHAVVEPAFNEPFAFAKIRHTFGTTERCRGDRPPLRRDPEVARRPRNPPHTHRPQVPHTSADCEPLAHRARIPLLLLWRSGPWAHLTDCAAGGDP